MKHSIQLAHISKSFMGIKALNDVNLTIKTGEVHALMGENGAGKSTLMKILLGMYRPDQGEIFIDGKKVEINSLQDAFKQGISMIHQELMPISDMTVAENIFLGREPVYKGTNIINRKKLISMTQKLLDEIRIESINPKSFMRELSVAETQLVEIAKAVSYNSKYIIMDEPTSAITDKEISKLFTLIHSLISKDVGVVYISHKMDEIFQISDTITVLRDGTYIGTKPSSELDEERLISMMVGRELNLYEKVESNVSVEVTLSVKNLCLDGVFQNISFSVRKGEILGIAGLMGAGRTEVVETIFGMRKKSKGEIFINGKKKNIKNVSESIKNNIALIPEDRKLVGLNVAGSIKENISIASLNSISNIFGLIKSKKEKLIVDQQIVDLRIKARDRNQQVQNLSGGNQQKVVLAKWLVTDADIIIFDEPTRGIDVGAKSEIHLLISKLAQKGKSIILISSEMPEIIAMSDRVLVMAKGRITSELNRDEITQESIMQAAMEF